METSRVPHRVPTEDLSVEDYLDAEIEAQIAEVQQHAAKILKVRHELERFLPTYLMSNPIHFIRNLKQPLNANVTN